jgi:hypothetical protein
MHFKVGTDATLFVDSQREANLLRPQIAALMCRWAILAACVFALPGCAHSYIDADGNRHVLGFVHLVTPRPENDRNIGAESVRVKSIGLSMLASPQRTNFTLGYSDDTLLFLRNNACVFTDPLPLFGVLSDKTSVEGPMKRGKP